ncbi:MAG: hypothetical protein LAT68_10780 [Cyclobacteriaceae bacterium]|nr:hypothetical protein [Cyclobacteriaceae bacterium]MCH8516800.1 hypothetical protein [Cyclobacteriaceae bacterium]
MNLNFFNYIDQPKRKIGLLLIFIFISWWGYIIYHKYAMKRDVDVIVQLRCAKLKLEATEPIANKTDSLEKEILIISLKLQEVAGTFQKKYVNENEVFNQMLKERMRYCEEEK